MKENLTELVFILDMSGSMGPLTDDTIGGFNSMIEDQKRKSGKNKAKIEFEYKKSEYQEI